MFHFYFFALGIGLIFMLNVYLSIHSEEALILD